VRYLANRASSLPANHSFRRHHPTFDVPPAWLLYDALGTVDLNHYFNSGLSDAEYIAEILGAMLNRPTPTVFEWGCGPGRVIRHLASLSDAALSGSDYNPKSVQWCQKYLEGIDVLHQSLHPPIAVGTDSIDFLYSISVHTHLSEAASKAWLAEHLRIVRPGGMILMTLNGDNHTNKLLPRERRAYDRGETVERGNVAEGSRPFLAFQSPQHVREVFLKGLNVVHHEPASERLASRQDVWIVKVS
jgi:SAM-dependent methyltransferase